MTGLTELTGGIRLLPRMPKPERLPAARLLGSGIEELLAAHDVDDQTVIRLWAQLARAIEPRTPVASASPAQARQAALHVLGQGDGIDPLQAVRDARAADDAAQTHAAGTRERLRAAVAAAARAGLPMAAIAREAGVSRQNLYSWTG